MACVCAPALLLSLESETKWLKQLPNMEIDKINNEHTRIFEAPAARLHRADCKWPVTLPEAHTIVWHHKN